MRRTASTPEMRHFDTSLSSSSFLPMMGINELSHGHDCEETEDDDFGFFPMDDEDDNDNSDNNNNQGGLQAAEENRLKIQQEQEQLALFEDTNNSKNNNNNNDNQASLLGSSYEGDDREGQRQKPSGRKSSLRRGSSYGNEEGIPLDFERQEYNRVLPKPDILSKATPSGMSRRPSGRGLFRVSSEPVFVRPVYLESSNDNDKEQERRLDQLQLNTDANSITTDNTCGDDNSDRVSLSSSCSNFAAAAAEGGTLTHKKRISFGSIKIREHSQTIGDNPSCSYGTPVQLDWDYEQLEDVKVEDYEAYRPSTRTKQEFQLNHYQRRNLLKLRGFSNNDIKKSKKEVSKVRNQRERTKFLVMNYPALTTVEDAIESGARKLKRTLKNKKENDNDNDDNNSSCSTSKDDSALNTRTNSCLSLIDMVNKDTTV
mmetsp:Transcript_53715/g.59995  ORF Transcript_53715/g.59995 Transcript_53715/m.59995 type:complete len:428 (-) Transcript_53715:115-1398(-)